MGNEKYGLGYGEKAAFKAYFISKTRFNFKVVSSQVKCTFYLTAHKTLKTVNLLSNYKRAE